MPTTRSAPEEVGAMDIVKKIERAFQAIDGVLAMIAWAIAVLLKWLL